MAILRTLVFIVIGYYVLKLVDAAFFSKNAAKGQNSRQRKPQTKVKFNRTDKSHIPDSEGDYIDYQEIK